VPDVDRMAFCYLDPGSAWHRGCHSAMTRDGVIAYGHHQTAALATAAAALSRTHGARAWLELACTRTVGSNSLSATSGGRVRSDARIEQTMTSLQAADLHSDLSAAALATRAGLSTSPFLHLFRQHTGTSLRRHRSWLRMVSAARRVRDDADLSTAAMDAGFASPSHFSTSFRGEPPASRKPIPFRHRTIFICPSTRVRETPVSKPDSSRSRIADGNP